MSSAGDTAKTRRALVEAVVIIVSILMAFGIEAGWDRLQARAAELAFLEEVRAELVESRGALEESLGYHREFRDSAQVVVDYGSGRASESPPSRGAIYYTLLTARSTHLETGVLDGAIASGQLGSVTDQALRGRLAGWPATVGEFIEEEVLATEFIMSIRPIVAQHLDLAPMWSAGMSGPVPERDLAFLRTLEARNLAQFRVEDERFASRDGERLISALDELLDLLEEHLTPR